MWTLKDYPKLNVVRESIEDIKKEIPEQYLREQDSQKSGDVSFLRGKWSYGISYIPEWFNPMWFSETLSLTKEESSNIRQRTEEDFPLVNNIMRDVPEADYAGFTLLHAKSHLKEHKHLHKKGTRQMLMLLHGMPAGCGLRSDENVLNWQRAGDIVIFDHTALHESWNNTDKDRICFYVNFTPKF